MSKPRKKNIKGFTLIEVIMTVAILAFGIVSIYEALFVSVDAHSYYTYYLNTQDWINEKISEIQEELMESQALNPEQTSGQIVRDNKIFNWTATINQLDEVEGLYLVSVTLSWKVGNKIVHTSRSAYLLPPQLKTYYEEGFA